MNGTGLQRGLPIRVAFIDKDCIGEARTVQSEWAAAFGAQHVTLTGEFMDAASEGSRVEIRYRESWHITDERIVDSRAMVDFPDMVRQFDGDPFNGQGWERLDPQSTPAAKPENH